MTMRTYTVTVKVTLLEYYEVEAATADDALANWRDGWSLGTGDSHLDAEPLTAEASPSASTMLLHDDY